MKHITRTIWVLSLVSLFTDTASEMLYPVMPVYLQSIGFSVLLIGVLEGIAEATAGLSKGYFGKRSDITGKRVPFVQLGYTLSALSKPMMAFAVFPLWIFMARTIDRLGKGIRTGARDALLSDEATPETKGKVFGFHRSMDTIGAVAGPAFALLYLYVYPEQYIHLFYIAFIPGLLAILASLLLRDKSTHILSNKKPVSFFVLLQYWKESPPTYKKVVGGLLAFTLFNSSDVFLLLKAKECGLSDSMVIGVYIFYNMVYALFAFPLGIIGDQIGLRKLFISGLFVFSIVYAGMGIFTDTYAIIALFFMYGIYAAATEGVSKAWISNLISKKETATAIGTYTAYQSLFALLASSLAGVVWFTFGSNATFVLTGFATLFIILYFIIFTGSFNQKQAA